jgi:hypothetical protein
MTRSERQGDAKADQGELEFEIGLLVPLLKSSTIRWTNLLFLIVLQQPFTTKRMTLEMFPDASCISVAQELLD